VAKSAVGPGPVPDGPAGRFLAEAVRVKPSVGRSGDGARLVVAHDMIPTISALTEPRGKAETAKSEAVLPLLVAGAEPTQPAIRLDLSRTSATGSTWPLLKSDGAGLPAAFPPAAIRVVAVGPRRPITWLIEASAWEERALGRAVHALSLQDGGEGDHLAFIGPVDRAVLSSVKDRFAGILTARDLKSAIARVETALTGFIGAHVLLHDHRSAETFSSLLEQETVATVSCTLVSTRNSHAAIVDAGAIEAPAGPPERARVAELLWRSNYPVAFPSPQLWVARTAQIRAWAADPRKGQESDGLHLCSTVVTASYSGPSGSSLLPAFIPRAAPSQVTRAEVLFGSRATPSWRCTTSAVSTRRPSTATPC
jgi:hypothetical protein